MEDSYPYELGRSQIVFDNSNQLNPSVTIVAAGPLLHQALMAAQSLSLSLEEDITGEGAIGTVVIHPSIINKPDLETLLTALTKTSGRLVTVEDHQAIGGLGSLTAHKLAQNGVDFKMKSLGVNDEFGQSSYKAIELYAKHKLDSTAIAKAARSLADQ